MKRIRGSEIEYESRAWGFDHMPVRKMSRQLKSVAKTSFHKAIITTYEILSLVETTYYCEFVTLNLLKAWLI